MKKLGRGDRIDVRIKDALIVSPYKSYDEIKTFEIVSVDEYGYYLFIPVYFDLKDSVIADQYRCKRLNIDKKFLDENIVYIHEELISKINYILDGMMCCKCQDFYAMAEANQEDGTLICYTCRFSKYH